jgi:FtsZ-interacting cell division protein YlmF
VKGYLDYLKGRDCNRKETPDTKTNYDKFRETGYSQGKRAGAQKEGILRPHSLSDIERLIDMLKEKKGIVVDLSGEGMLSQRMLDFFSGAIYALGGNIHRIEKRLYIIMPKGVKLMTDDKVDKDDNKKSNRTQKAN